LKKEKDSLVREIDMKEEQHFLVIQKGTGYVVGHIKDEDLDINTEMFTDTHLKATLESVTNSSCMYCSCNDRTE